MNLCEIKVWSVNLNKNKNKNTILTRNYASTQTKSESCQPGLHIRK